LQRYLSAVFTGRMTSEQAMKAAAQETRNILGRFKSAQVSQNLEVTQNVAASS
jgi:multiple sugar transport system substrate-binding protein